MPGDRIAKSAGTVIAASGFPGFRLLTSDYRLWILSFWVASVTAHIGAMYAAFLAISVDAGVPLTHYGGAAGPILFGAGYVT